jgi:hypothetical protein
MCPVPVTCDLCPVSCVLGPVCVLALALALALVLLVVARVGCVFCVFVLRVCCVPKLPT